MRSITIEPRPATVAGAMPGWAVVCSDADCGEHTGLATRMQAGILVKDHRDWHAERDSIKRQEMLEATAEGVAQDLWNAMSPITIDEDDRLEAAGRVGLYLHTLMHPDDPDSGDIDSVRLGVEQFLAQMRGDN